MTALSILVELRRQGVGFVIDGERLRVITPRGVTLSDTLKTEIRTNKKEIIARLRSGGITFEDVAAVFPGAEIIETSIDLGACARCHTSHWWVISYGMKVCGKCFPPVRPDLVTARITSKSERNAA